MTDRPPLPPTCRTDEPWVNPWTTEPCGYSQTSLRILATLLTIAAISLAVCFAIIAIGGWA
jgi:hypothetical protein